LESNIGLYFVVVVVTFKHVATDYFLNQNIV